MCLICTVKSLYSHPNLVTIFFYEQSWIYQSHCFLIDILISKCYILFMLTLAIVWFHILCYVLGFQIGPRQITEKQKDSL